MCKVLNANSPEARGVKEGKRTHPHRSKGGNMKRINFNSDWLFWSDENPGEKIPVHLPFDAMQTEARIPNLKNGPLVAEFPGGDYWYEKIIQGTDEYIDKTVWLEFGGVYMDSHVYVNGEEVGGHHYGYSNFYVDLSGKLMAGKENRIQIYVRNSLTPNARWYSGSGIYRPVWLLIGPRNHIVPDGVQIKTISIEPAVVEVATEIAGEFSGEVEVSILKNGVHITSGEGCHCQIAIPNAKLWSDDSPELYDYCIRLRKNGETLDEHSGKFGIRDLRWNEADGLTINGCQKKLRGVCVHHDNGIIGAAESKKSALRKVTRLKSAGFNAIRGSHNPASKELLDACDEVGLYYIEEFFDGWFTSGAYGYVMYIQDEWQNDMELAVQKCFNHPSVIMYSIGNEIPETAKEKGLAIARRMTERLHELDSTRPVTMGVNLMMNVMYQHGVKLGGENDRTLSLDDERDPKSEAHDNHMDGSVLFNTIVGIAAAEPFIRACAKPKRSDPATREIFDILDIAGYNYGDVAYQKHHEYHPARIMVGTETKPFGMAKRLEAVRRNPFVIGDFIWTGWDYLGECGIGVIDYGKKENLFGKPYPCISAGCGLFDLIGHRETHSYEAAIAWGVTSESHISVSPLQHSGEKMYKSMYRLTDGIDSWTFPGFEGKPTTIRVSGPGMFAKLWINGKSLGKKRLKDLHAEWKAVYIPGTVRAEVYDDAGCLISSSTLKTASRPMEIILRPDCEHLQADEEDLCYLDISLEDGEEIYYPVERRLSVEVEGAACLMAVGSADPRAEEPYTGTSFKTYYGRMLAVIRSNGQKGPIKVSVRGDGLDCKELYLLAE